MRYFGMHAVRALCGLLVIVGLTPSNANAQSYVYVGSWTVDQLSWNASSDNNSHLPYAFTGQGAAAYLFGGTSTDYAISTAGSNPADINFSNWITSWGCSYQCDFSNNVYGAVVAQDFVIGSSDGSVPCMTTNTGTVGGGPYYACGNGTSALLQDWATGPKFTNYAFAIVEDGAVPEPATWAMMLLGFGGIGFAMRRRRFAATLQAA